jgi:hypothetical protein
VYTPTLSSPASSLPLLQGKLIPNVVVQHYNGMNLSNANVPQDILGRACEYFIKDARR